MSTIKWLDNLLLLETVLGIYRNYCTQKKIAKYFIIFKIFFQFTLNTIICSIKLYFLLRGAPDHVNVMLGAFTVLAYLNSVSYIMTSIYYSGAFVSYYRSITRVFDCFKDDKRLIKSLKKIYWSTIIITLSFLAFIIIRSLDVSQKLTDMNEFLVVVTFAVQIIIRISIIYQHIMLFVIIIIVVNLSKCLTSLVTVVQESVGSCDVRLDEQCDITEEQIQGWVKLYRDLVNCCEKVTLCFELQYLFSLALSIPNYILMINRTCFYIGLSDGYTDEFRKVILALIIYGLVTFMPIVAGQLARNQGKKFQRMLARLYNTIIVIDLKEAEAKLIKDLTLER